MSKLTVRAYKEGDADSTNNAKWLDSIATSQDKYAASCIENDKVVGSSFASVWSDGTGTLEKVLPLVAEREDIVLALALWHVEKAIALGLKAARVATAPAPADCDTKEITDDLVDSITPKIRQDLEAASVVTARDIGIDTSVGKSTEQEWKVADLEAMKDELLAQLTVLGAEVAVEL